MADFVILGVLHRSSHSKQLAVRLVKFESTSRLNVQVLSVIRFATQELGRGGNRLIMKKLYRKLKVGTTGKVYAHIFSVFFLSCLCCP